MKSRRSRIWILSLAVVLGGAACWLLAVLVLPASGWLGPGQVTGFGLVVIVGMLIFFLVREHKEIAAMDEDRIARRRRRRARMD